VVNCFEGSSSTESVATTTIRIIDPGQFGKKKHFRNLNCPWVGGDVANLYKAAMHNIQAIYVLEFTMRAHIIIWIPHFNLDLSVRSHSEQFSSNEVTVSLEWTLLNSQSYYQQLLSNISVNAVPQLNNVMPTGNMRVQLTLSYNTPYNVSVTQHSVCQQLIRTRFLLLNYSKLYTFYQPDSNNMNSYSQPSVILQ
jgi:hypothetical protein